MRRPKQKSEAELQAECDAFNKLVAVGEIVQVRKDDGAKVLTKTESAAYVLSGHTAVIFLNGISGCYSLDRVSRAGDSDFEPPLTDKNVEAVFFDCFFRDGEDTSNAVIAKGIYATFGFHPDRLEARRAQIDQLLMQLADFDAGSGLLNACLTREGRQWGSPQHVEQLLVLGVAAKQISIAPGEGWGVQGNGMPLLKVRKAQVAA